MAVDEELVALAKLGEDDAFSKLYASVYKDMYKYAYYMLGDAYDAEDVVSETVLEMYSGIKSLRQNSLFRAWTFKILSNKCKRKRKQYLKKIISLDDEDQNIELYESQCDLELKHDLELALDILSLEEREIVSLSVFCGYNSNEIGEILQIKPATARSKLSRALAKMQRKMKVQF